SVSHLFHRSGCHSDLYSFPTRRSSDLGRSCRSSLTGVHSRRRRRGGRSDSSVGGGAAREPVLDVVREGSVPRGGEDPSGSAACSDRKSTRLNSSHVKISYAVFCLKKKR